MTPQDRRAQLKVLIGGAHPEGKLDMAAVEELRQQLNQMQSEDSLREFAEQYEEMYYNCLLYTSPSPRDRQKSRMPSSA